MTTGQIDRLKDLKIVKDSLIIDDDIELKEDEFLLKIRGIEDHVAPTGFLCQLNKNGTVPKAFKGWGAKKIFHPQTRTYERSINLKTFLVTEKFRKGWKLKDVRHGMSTTWIIVEHPFGFELEVSEKHLEFMLLKLNINSGKIQNKCKFDYRTKNLIIEGV